MLVPRTEGRIVTACSWASQKWEHLDPGPGRRHRAWSGPPWAATATRPSSTSTTPPSSSAVVEDLTAARSTCGARPRATSVHRWPRAFPQYRPGHLDRVAAMEAALGRDAPEVVVAGMHLRGVGIPAAVASGEAAADRTLARLSAR